MKFIFLGKRFAAILLAGVLLTMAGLSTLSQAQTISPAQKAEFEALIRTYILENPEILAEAQEALQRKQELALKVRMKRTLEERADLIFASKNQSQIGNPNGDVTVVEFFDYNCPFCKRAMADMDRLLEGDPKLKFVLKELPILSEASVEAHRVSVAVGRLVPDRYSEFHRKLMGGNGQKDGRRALKIVEDMGLDLDKIFEMSKQEDVNDVFREVNGLATSLGMNGTPSYVIGDEVIFGALGYNVLKKKIDNYRKCGSTVCS